MDYFVGKCKHLNIQDEAYKATTLHTHLHGAMKLFRVAVFAVLHINIFKWTNLASGISKQSGSTIPHHLVTSMDQDQDQFSTTYEFLQPAGNLSICRIYSCILATKHPPPTTTHFHYNLFEFSYCSVLSTLSLICRLGCTRGLQFRELPRKSD